MAIGKIKQCLDQSRQHTDLDSENNNNGDALITSGGIRKIVDPRNEPKVKPGEMLEDYKFTQK